MKWLEIEKMPLVNIEYLKLEHDKEYYIEILPFTQLGGYESEGCYFVIKNDKVIKHGLVYGDGHVQSEHKCDIELSRLINFKGFESSDKEVAMLGMSNLAYHTSIRIVEAELKNCI